MSVLPTLWRSVTDCRPLELNCGIFFCLGFLLLHKTIFASLLFSDILQCGSFCLTLLYLFVQTIAASLSLFHSSSCSHVALAAPPVSRLIYYSWSVCTQKKPTNTPPYNLSLFSPFHFFHSHPRPSNPLQSQQSCCQSRALTSPLSLFRSPSRSAGVMRAPPAVQSNCWDRHGPRCPERHRQAPPPPPHQPRPPPTPPSPAPATLQVCHQCCFFRLSLLSLQSHLTQLVSKQPKKVS